MLPYLSDQQIASFVTDPRPTEFSQGTYYEDPRLSVRGRYFTKFLSNDQCKDDKEVLIFSYDKLTKAIAYIKATVNDEIDIVSVCDTAHDMRMTYLSKHTDYKFSHLITDSQNIFSERFEVIREEPLARQEDGS